MARGQKKSSEQNKYGPTLRAGEAEKVTMETFEISRIEKVAGRKGMPVCSWGEAGIGKTELPNMLVKKYADFFGGDSKNGIPGNIVYLPMAQIEEKAELQGLPELQNTKRLLKYDYTLIKKATAKAKEAEGVELLEVVDSKMQRTAYVSEGSVSEAELSSVEIIRGSSIGGNDVATALIGAKKVTLMLTPETLDGSQMIIEEVIDGTTRKFLVDNRTIYATPSWIPQVETHGEKGLLVIDDMNRADARIINSIMQLLQDGRLLGWSLPLGWEIYCTCNPDDGKYEVTGFDGAQMTRMVNFVQEFDKDTWLADWAIPTGIHPTAQNFVMTHSDMCVQGERTNPRSLDKFFRLVAPFLDVIKKATEDKISISGKSKAALAARRIEAYGKMNIEETTLQQFINFVISGYGKLPDVEEIIDPKFDLKEFYTKITEGASGIRVDILASLNTRLVIHIREKKNLYNEDDKSLDGIRNWIKYKDTSKEGIQRDMPADLRYNTAKDLADLIPNIVDEELCEIIYGRIK